MTGKCLLSMLAFAMLSAASPETAAPATLHLKIENLRSSKGTVRICLWQDNAGFPDCKKNARNIVKLAPAAPVVDVHFAGLAPGSYAISAIHDENDNRKMDKSFVGRPTEGFAFSNDAKVFMGPPKFDKMLVAVSGPAAHTMKMRYFL